MERLRESARFTCLIKTCLIWTITVSLNMTQVSSVIDTSTCIVLSCTFYNFYILYECFWHFYGSSAPILRNVFAEVISQITTLNFSINTAYLYSLNNSGWNEWSKLRLELTCWSRLVSVFHYFLLCCQCSKSMPSSVLNVLWHFHISKHKQWF